MAFALGAYADQIPGRQPHPRMEQTILIASNQRRNAYVHDDSGIEILDLENEPSDFNFNDFNDLPTPLKEPRLPHRNESVPEQATAAASHSRVDTQIGVVPFVASGEVPRKKRILDSRYNRIRPASVKREYSVVSEQSYNAGLKPSIPPEVVMQHEERKLSRMWSMSPAGSDGETVPSGTESDQSGPSRSKPCCDCRAKHQKCTHSTSGPSAQRVPIKKSPPTTTRIKKEEKTYKRVPHDRSKGPSMTPSAIDYRERKVQQKQYEEKLAALLDDDIVDQVEDEGGITPLGRLFKAGVRMLERVQAERAGRQGMTQHDDDGRQYSVDQNRILRKTPVVAEDKLVEFKDKLRALLEECE